MTTEITPSAGLFSGFADKENGWGPQVNANWLTLELLSVPIVTSAVVSTPPASPASGDRYIIPANATGSWLGKDNQIALYMSSTWYYFPAKKGWLFRSLSESKTYQFDGTVWKQYFESLSQDTMQKINAAIDAGQTATAAALQASTSKNDAVAAKAGAEAARDSSVQAATLSTTNKNDTQAARDVAIQAKIDAVSARDSASTSERVAVYAAQTIQDAADSSSLNAAAAQTARDITVAAKLETLSARDSATASAGVATAKAGESSDSANVSTTQAGISTAKAAEAAASANAAAAAAMQLADYAALRSYNGALKAVYVTGYQSTSAPSGIAGYFTRDDTDTTSADNGGTIIVDASGRRWKRKFNGAVNVDWFGAVSNDSTDSYSAVQAAIEYVNYIGGGEVLCAGKYTISAPIVLYQNVTLRGNGAQSSQLRKTTNTVGSKTGALAPNRTSLTDSFAVDAVVIVYHAASTYAYNVTIKDITICGKNNNTYGIYAPRVSHIFVENCYIKNVQTGYYTFDAWLCNYRNITCQAVCIGFQYDNDGSNMATGTSSVFNLCWVNFDNTINNPKYGFQIYGVSYSCFIGCAVDNLISTDNTHGYAYFIQSAQSLSLLQCGCENGRAGVLYAENTYLYVESLRTFAMTANSAWGTVGTIFNTGSSITLANCRFDVTSPGTGIYNIVLQSGGNQTEIECSMPSGGNGYISYTGNAQRTQIKSGAITISNSNGSKSPVLSSVAASTAPTIASGFGTGPVLTGSSASSFKVVVGTSPSATGTITLPAAPNGWSCTVQDVTSASSVVVSQTASTTTSVTVGAFSRTTGASTNFVAGDVLIISCIPF